MNQAVRCPVCGGSGQHDVRLPSGGTGPVTQPCHGCGGKGWVEVGGPGAPRPYAPLYDVFPPASTPQQSWEPRITNSGSLYGPGSNTIVGEFHQA